MINDGAIAFIAMAILMACSYVGILISNAKDDNSSYAPAVAVAIIATIIIFSLHTTMDYNLEEVTVSGQIDRMEIDNHKTYVFVDGKVLNTLDALPVLQEGDHATFQCAYYPKNPEKTRYRILSYEEGW